MPKRMLLFLLALPLQANLIYTNATTGSITPGGIYPAVQACSGSTVDGDVYAASSFTCDYPYITPIGTTEAVAASAIAQSGLGPLGIGVNLSLDAGGWGFPDDPFAFGVALWDGDFMPTGAVGDGFIQFDYDWRYTLAPIGAMFRPVAEFDGQSLCPNFAPFVICSGTTGMIPITFGTDYSLLLSAKGYMQASAHIGAQPDFGVTINAIRLFDASGTPVNAIASNPEPTSFILLLTAITAFTIYAVARRAL